MVFFYLFQILALEKIDEISLVAPAVAKSFCSGDGSDYICFCGQKCVLIVY
uniref:Uncharacterized protein n=1 Tax=Arundo donax TaxID=35708 RepID=A0A0A8ZMD1_ARUDO